MTSEMSRLCNCVTETLTVGNELQNSLCNCATAVSNGKLAPCAAVDASKLRSCEKVKLKSSSSTAGAAAADSDEEGGGGRETGRPGGRPRRPGGRPRRPGGRPRRGRGGGDGEGEGDGEAEGDDDDAEEEEESCRPDRGRGGVSCRRADERRGLLCIASWRAGNLSVKWMRGWRRQRKVKGCRTPDLREGGGEGGRWPNNKERRMSA